MLVGEPGIGKSRLAAEALRAAVDLGFVCVSGVAYPLHRGLAYAPVRDAFGPYLHELDPARQAGLVGGLPDLGRLFGGLRLPPPEPLGDPALERTRLFEAVARLLDRIAEDRPLAVLIDDLQWADTASLELLHYLGRGLAGRPILLLGTYREAEARNRPELLALVRSLERLELGCRLDVRGLDKDAVGALAAAMLGGDPPAGLTDLLDARAAGTPLFVIALIRALVESGGLARGVNGWTLTGELPAPVPPVVRDLVLGRLEHLRPADRSLLELVAVAGDAADLDVLERASGKSPGTVAEALRQLCQGGLIVEELDWADSRHAQFLDRLGSYGRLIRFDKRGTGMSDRPPGLPDLEKRMHDVLAVMDAVGSYRAVLVGYSEGGPMAILFAATHPERVASLVLYGSYAKRTRAEDYPWAQTQEDREEYTERLVTRWDWEHDLRMRCPSGDESMQRWWAQRMRASATPSTVRALMDMNSLVDVRDVLGAVRVPTLVLHRTGDALFRPEEARYLADHIAGARLELLDGADHFVAGNPDQILDAMEPFLREVPQRTSSPLALAAIVAPAGAGADALAADLAATGGRLRTGPAGRPVVLFDGPATAVRAGLARLRQPARLGLAIAEVPRDDPQLEANGVQVAITLGDIAPPGSLWVSSPVRDLLAGSGVVLEPVGSHQVGAVGSQPVFRAIAVG